jgi:hypothetical protein
VEETTTKLQKLDCSNLEVCILNLTKWNENTQSRANSLIVVRNI